MLSASRPSGVLLMNSARFVFISAKSNSQRRDAENAEGAEEKQERYLERIVAARQYILRNSSIDESIDG